MGGDHSITLAEPHALAAVHCSLGLVHLDSHTELWDTYNGLPYGHGTMFRRALIEGVLDPAQVIQAGMGGPLYGAADERHPERARCRDGPVDELGLRSSRRVPRTEVGDGLPSSPRRRLGRPRSVPGPGPGPGGRGATSFEAMQYLRALAGIPFVGYDVVEVAPQYDGPGDGLFAAKAILEMLSMVARRKRDATVRPA